ncbi:hypothetical protein CMQ_1569 [Grosmannia clavigera kw1407]|uniref:Regulator of phospholipase D SRF1 n=1 Tax=Grosmannia clavigera (strain kw1407 / UAMH 11150) TaxID=655863 RepID=F0XEZ5_GROCL|nr:uncharacterized protein CMQ_1569 [Grosmannia clavigera kw1407]EFX04641.1 hypothetical protein CMQ_1569 [Grosmannia clavigera kw1407]
MSRETVKTVPPWVIRRPPQTVYPQRNHDPSEARYNQGPSGGSVPNGKGQEHAGENGTSEGLNKPAPKPAGTTAPSPIPKPPAPTPAAAPSLRYRLSLLFRPKEGRKWDHLRSAEPVIVPQYHVTKGPTTYRTEWDRHTPRRPGAPGAPSGSSAQAGASSSASGHPDASAATARTPWWYNPESQWHAFIESTRYPHAANEKSEILDDEEMQRLNLMDFGYLSSLHPKVGGGDGGGGVGQFHHKLHVPSKLADKPVWQRIWELLLHHPLVPLACRLTVLMTSIVALAVAIEIHKRERLNTVGKAGSLGNAPERTQVIVAIVVDVVAVPYIGYITVDDYTGKPLGLRPPADRIRLILTDLFFIIFKSASTSLGFEAMIFVSSEGSEGLLRTLGAFELIGLVSWALTLTINIFRVIERLGG